MKETPFAGSIRFPITIARPDTPAPVALMGRLRLWIRFNGFAFIDRRVTFSHRCQVTFVELLIVPRQRISLLLAIGMGVRAAWFHASTRSRLPFITYWCLGFHAVRMQEFTFLRSIRAPCIRPPLPALLSTRTRRSLLRLTSFTLRRRSSSRGLRVGFHRVCIPRHSFTAELKSRILHQVTVPTLPP